MWLRRLGFDRNPLRRRADRAEALARVCLLAALLAGVPGVTVWASQAMYASGMRAVRVQETAWHRVPAVVVRVTAPAPSAWPYLQYPIVLARWPAPSGGTRTGEIAGTAGARPGSTTSVWTDQDGRLTHPPLTRAQVTGDVVRAAVAIATIMIAFLLTVGGVISLLLDRRRLSRWESEWSAVEPVWTGRR